MFILAFELEFSRPTASRSSSMHLVVLQCNPFTGRSLLFSSVFFFFPFSDASDHAYHECSRTTIYRKRKFDEVEVQHPSDINLNTMDENMNNEEMGERICKVDGRKDEAGKKVGKKAYPGAWTSPKEPDKERYGCIV